MESEHQDDDICVQLVHSWIVCLTQLSPHCCQLCFVSSFWRFFSSLLVQIHFGGLCHCSYANICCMFWRHTYFCLPFIGNFFFSSLSPPAKEGMTYTQCFPLNSNVHVQLDFVFTTKSIQHYEINIYIGIHYKNLVNFHTFKLWRPAGFRLWGRWLCCCSYYAVAWIPSSYISN